MDSFFRKSAAPYYSQGALKGRQQKGETGPGTHLFADFCRFSLIFFSLCKSRDLGVADLRRKPEETADFRRKPQKTADFCRNRFLTFAVSLLARSYTGKKKYRGKGGQNTDIAFLALRLGWFSTFLSYQMLEAFFTPHFVAGPPKFPLIRVKAC